MAQIEVTENQIQIDADILSRAFEISPDELKSKMREGAITSTAEHGEDEDAGRIRLTFFSHDCRVRITTDTQGNVLACDTARIAPPTGSEEHRWTQDALLDEALAESFPASDPIAISFDSSRQTDGNAGLRDRTNKSEKL